MHVSIIDIGGNFAGPALGIRSLGHRVTYFGTGDAAERLAARLGGRTFAPDWEADLVVYAASFADELWALEVGLQLEAPLSQSDPFFSTINPRQRIVRDRYLGEQLARVPELVLVDMSDTGERIDPLFLELGRHRFKRELPFYVREPEIHPFPFLYHPQLLSCEYERGLESLHVMWEDRGTEPGLLFAGMLDHWRYFGRRRQLFERFRHEHPGLRVEVWDSGRPLREVWEAMQRATGGLYLGGRGELCFRLHELAALGVPALRVEPWGIQVPGAWEEIVPTEPDRLPSPARMLEFYLRHYHPVRAAEWLLGRIAAADPTRRSPATPIMPARRAAGRDAPASAGRARARSPRAAPAHRA